MSKGVTSASGKQLEPEWQQFKDMARSQSKACTVETEEEKKAGAWFSTAEYRNAHRRRENIIGQVCTVVADLDHVYNPAAVLHALEDYEYIAWTTWNSTPEHPRWRIVMPIEGGVDPDEFSRLVERVLGPLTASAKVDPKSMSPEQLWFLPAHKHSQRKNHRVWENAGKWIRPTVNVDFSGVVNIHQPETIHEDRNNSLVKRLQSPDARNCASEPELLTLAMGWNARLPKPMERTEVRDVVRKSWKWIQSLRAIPNEGDWESKLRGWKPKASATELLKIPELAFLLRPWVQRGQAGQLVAEGGTGKTTVKIHLMVCIAAELPDWLGLPIEHHGTCVLLSLDDSQEDLDAVLAEIIRGLNLSPRQIDLVRKRVRLISLRGCNVAFSHGNQRTDAGERIATGLKGIDDLVSIGFDTHRQFAGSDSNDDRGGMIVAQTVSAIAERTGATCILSHHVGKGQSRSGVDDMYVGLGSTAVPDTLRFVLRLEKSSWAEVREALHVDDGRIIVGDIFRLSSKRGSLRVRAPQPIYFVREGFRLTRIDYEAKSQEQRHSEELGVVIAAIDAAGTALSANKITPSLRGRRMARLARLKYFVAQGWLAYDDGGELVVTDAGRSTRSGDRPKGGNQGHHPAQRKTAAAGVGSDRRVGHQRSPASPLRPRKVVRK
ncbi:MAG: AAA family ATPase [Usitatibacter sp.]